MHRILVTGAAGFIGSHLALELRRAGHTVYTTDRRPRDLLGGSVDFQFDLLGHRRGGYDQWPTCKPLDDVLGEVNADVVIHLAAQVGRQFGEDAPAVAAVDNVGMTALVARSCVAAGARLVYASTSEVYGDVGQQIAQEDYCDGITTHTSLYADLPHNVYGLTKRQAEEVAALYCSAHGTGCAVPTEAGLQIIRPSMPYGPGLPPGRGRAAIVNFLWDAHYGRPLTVHRDAERSWCWIGDTVAGIRLVVEEGDVAYTYWQWRDGMGVYNVGQDHAPTSMLDVASLAWDIAAPDACGDPLVVLVDAPARQTIVKRLSMAKLRALGWAPAVSLEEGMTRTHLWLQAGQW